MFNNSSEFNGGGNRQSPSSLLIALVCCGIGIAWLLFHFDQLTIFIAWTAFGIAAVGSIFTIPSLLAGYQLSRFPSVRFSVKTNFQILFWLAYLAASITFIPPLHDPRVCSAFLVFSLLTLLLFLGFGIHYSPQKAMRRLFAAQLVLGFATAVPTSRALMLASFDWTTRLLGRQADRLAGTPIEFTDESAALHYRYFVDGAPRVWVGENLEGLLEAFEGGTRHWQTNLPLRTPTPDDIRRLGTQARDRNERDRVAKAAKDAADQAARDAQVKSDEDAKEAQVRADRDAKTAHDAQVAAATEKALEIKAEENRQNAKAAQDRRDAAEQQRLARLAIRRDSGRPLVALQLDAVTPMERASTVYAQIRTALAELPVDFTNDGSECDFSLRVIVQQLLNHSGGGGAQYGVRDTAQQANAKLLFQLTNGSGKIVSSKVVDGSSTELGGSSAAADAADEALSKSLKAWQDQVGNHFSWREF